MTDRYRAKIEVLKFDSVKMLETASGPTTANITAHGLSNGDFFVNLTRAENPPVRYGGETARRKIQNATTDSFQMYTVSGQTAGDVIVAYSFQDVTDRLLDGSLKMQLQTQGENNAEFRLKSYYTAPGYFYCLDGYDHTLYLKITWEYNLPRKTWVGKNPNSQYRVRNSSASIDTIMFDTVGYNGVLGDPITSHEAYNRDLNSWSIKTDAPNATIASPSTAINDEMYIYGGYDYSAYFNDTAKYNLTVDSWTTLSNASTNRGEGDGLNLADTFFVAYSVGDFAGTGFADDDIFYIPYNDVWITFMVDHNPPNRALARSGFTIDGFKGSLIGGTLDFYGDPTYAIANHTLVNFACKVYTERQDIPDALQEAYVNQYEQYSLMAGGSGGYSDTDPRSFFDAAYYWNSAADTWNAIESIFYPCSAGIGGGI